MSDKRALRAMARAARAAGGPQPPIAPPAPLLALFRPGIVVATYRPVGSEADPAALDAAALATGARLALPVTRDRETALAFRAWQPDDALVAGPFGLFQPAEDAPVLVPDIVLAPLVAFDARLNRIGQGAGHYDRAFAAHPHARRIGVAFAMQQVPPFEPDPWDLPLEAIVTDLGWRTA